MRRSGHTRTWPCWPLGTLGLLLLLSVAACESGRPAPTATRTPFAPQTAPTPVSIQAYVEQAYLRQTKRVEFVDPRTKTHRVSEDQVVIQQIVDLLQSPDKHVDSAGQGPQDSFLLLMVVPIRWDDKTMDHAVTVDYNSQTDVVSLSNIPTGVWAISLRGRYTVPHSFGPALFGILGIGS